ncbi:MAG: VWA domain-containing protein [Halothiobacillaceae bacterium]
MMPSFAHPWLLILLPLVLWLGWRLRSGAPAAFSRPPITLRHPILARLNLAKTQSASAPRLWLPVVAALLVLAAAQPQTQGGWLPPLGEGRDILLLIDTSPSMAIQDMSLDNHTVPRMEILKHAAQGFIDGRTHDRIGIIVFSDHAATIIPQTHDHTAVQAQLARLSSGNTGAATAIGEGLGVALRQIEAHPTHPPVLVLFSDGDNTGGILRPREALAYAERLGLHLYSVAVTPDAPTPAPQADGLREPSLSEMSELTGGRAYQAGDASSLQRILSDIDQREATHTPPPSERTKIEWYPLPLSLALLLLALGQWYELRGHRR